VIIDRFYEKQICDAQMDFYRRNKAGCLFAAVAAKNPEAYGWYQRVLAPEAASIKATVVSAIAARGVSTLSLIFPRVQREDALLNLIEILQDSGSFYLDQETPFKGSYCLGLRAPVENLTSWVSGFGPFDFLPVTRQSPYTEITFRVKRRPNYKWVMKESPKDVIHLADLNMLGMADAMFRTMWRATLKRTARLIGHEPDLRSAAKTTFAVPEAIWLKNFSLNV
jgi:hypothetical protein